MSTINDINKVKRNIVSIYDRKVAGVYALCLQYSAMAIEYFRAQQRNNKYWNNESYDAMNKMFAKPFKENKIIGWFMSHGVDYGIYLETANDRRNEAIRPIIQRYAGRFLNAVKEFL